MWYAYLENDERTVIMSRGEPTTNRAWQDVIKTFATTEEAHAWADNQNRYTIIWR